MAVKNYYLAFGTGNPADNSGLAPSFIAFTSAAGSTTAPSISEIASTGIYYFQYEVAEGGNVAFVADGATTGLADGDRYIFGALDILDRFDQFFGASTDAIGDSATDPTTFFGFLKRFQELLEGDSSYAKSTGVLTMLDRTGATTLASKTIAESASTVSKS